MNIHTTAALQGKYHLVVDRVFLGQAKALRELGYEVENVEGSIYEGGIYTGISWKDNN